jgi:hypothetical protein
MLLILYVELLDKSFEKYNYKYPQPLIKIFGIPVLNWILNYMNLSSFNKIIILYNNLLYKYDIKYTLESKYSDIIFNYIYTPSKTESKDDLIKFISSNINNNNEQYLFMDTKYLFLKDILDNTLKLNNSIKLNETNLNFYIKDKNEPLNMFYINNIEQIFNPFTLDEDIYISLETPFHIRLFCNNFPKIHALTNNLMITEKTIAFDLEDIKKGYSIDIIQYLYKLGNTIIIETTLSDNKESEIIDILYKKDIKYHKIYFNKPQYDFHISTKSFTYNDNLEKELGFYNNKIETREFNNIIQTNIKTYKKISDDLSGEIHYYLNIPIQIKDIFPIMLNYDDLNKWYEMENINGIPISKLYLNEELTIEQLDNILGTITRIHSIIPCYNIINQITIPIYNNYSNKLKKRYENFDYSVFENSDILYNKIYKGLVKYEDQNLGISCMIHGDAVFTNILINNLGKIKLIDMRGKLDNILSIYGDKLYDWAKIYQSLIGYDEILENKHVSYEYKLEIQSYFLNKFSNIFKDPDYKYYLNIITASLLFTLIPLHNNDKCIKYYKLIDYLEI